MSIRKNPPRRRRRTRGEGSVFLRGQKDIGGRGLWVLQLSSQGADGKRKRNRVTYRGTEDEAKLELQRLRLRTADGSSDPTNETIRDFLLERWLPTIRSDVALRTYLRYQRIVELHLVPALGSLRLSRLTTAHVEAAKQHWLREGCARTDHRKGQALAPRTVLHHLRVLHNALEMAVRWGLVSRNASSRVQAPRPQRPSARALNGAEAAALLKAAKGTIMFAPLVVALTTGVRRGELLGLRWRDLNEQTAALTVARSIEQTRGQLAFKSPKNGRERVIKLGRFTVAVLQEHRQSQHAAIFHRRQLGEEYHHEDLIFAAANGGIWPPATFGWRFGTIVKRAGIGAFCLHDLRHSSASLLIAQGVDLKRVSERLGHSGIAITADTYGHLFIDGQTAAAEAIDSAIVSAMTKQ
jgi:integrase